MLSKQQKNKEKIIKPYKHMIDSEIPDMWEWFDKEYEKIWERFGKDYDKRY